jgi:hypothetical protein
MELWQWFRRKKPVRFTKVYCTNCEYFRKELNSWWRKELHFIDNKYSVYCDHPVNLRGTKKHWDSFEKRNYFTDNPKSPRVNNYKNNCTLFTWKKREGWEV